MAHPTKDKAVTFWRDLAQTDRSAYLDQTGEKYGPLFVSNNLGMIITGARQLKGDPKAELDKAAVAADAALVGG